METGSCKSYWREEKWKWILTFFAGNILIYSARVTMSITMPSVSEELGWDKQVSGTALSAFFCGYVCTNVLGGHMADRIGGERVICYVGIGWAVLTLVLPFLARVNLFGLSPTVLVIFSRFLTGLSQGVFFPSLASITVKRIAPEEKGFFTGFVTSGSPVGSALTGFFGSMILEAISWQYVFISVGSLSVLWILWLRYLILRQESETLLSQEKNNSQSKENIPWRVLIRKRPFWALFVAYFTGHFAYFTFLSWAPVYFHDSFPKGKKALFNTVPYIVAFLVSNVCGYAGNRLAVKKYSTTFIRKLFGSGNLLGISVGSLMLTFVGSFEQALFVMSMTIGFHSFSVCSISLNSQDLAPKHAGALHGFINGSGALAGMLGNYVSGVILKITKEWALVFVLNSVMVFVGFLSFLVFGSGESVV